MTNVTGSPLEHWDTHLHLDQYGGRAEHLVEEAISAGVGRIVAVSTGPDSNKRTLAIGQLFPGAVLPAFGFHPEQPLPDDGELDRLFAWIGLHREQTRCIGEVGLPYFSTMEALRKGERFDVSPYVALLERFAVLAAVWDVPLGLHAVYEDADTVCDVLERNNVRKAHFHWFKGENKTAERIIRNGYFVSVTPECLYDEETMRFVEAFPMEQLLTETDGPWPFEGPYAGQETHPRMIGDLVPLIARLKGADAAEAARQLSRNAQSLYG